MAISFFKVPKHRVYDYQPIYYDPEKERREQRRRELGLTGDDASEDEKSQGVGSLIRGGAMRQRHRNFSEKMRAQRKRSQFMLLAIAIVLIIIAYYMMREFSDEIYEVIFKN